MSFKPTTAQLELLAELEMARMPVAVIADRLGVDEEVVHVGGDGRSIGQDPRQLVGEA